MRRSAETISVASRRSLVGSAISAVISWTEVPITMRDGTVHASAQFAARSILEPLTGAAVVEKFHHLTTGVIGNDRQSRLVGIVTAHERQPDLQELQDVLRPVVTSPFEGNQ